MKLLRRIYDWLFLTPKSLGMEGVKPLTPEERATVNEFFWDHSYEENESELEPEKKVWNIERLEIGVWEACDWATSEDDALMLASAMTGKTGEDKIRIITPEGKII